MADALPFPVGLGVAEAQARIVEIAATRMLAAEVLPIERALGRTLARDVAAPRAVPGFANSAMDGYALRGEELPATGERPFRLLGQVLAGGGDAEVVPGGCVRVTTGAPLPRGADTVVMKENTRTDGDQVWVNAGTAPGAHVRPADEDYAAGDLALRAGARLVPAALGVLASFGLTEVAVRRRPRAVLVTTGDELTPLGEPLGFGRIYDSNRYSLGSLLERHGVELVRHERVRDDPALLRAALERAAGDAEIVLSSGGVSVGEADFMPRLLAEIGEVYFWKVRMRPGMPFLFARVGAALMAALPGNPVSGIATFLALVRPALDAMSGAMPSRTLRARLATAVHKRHARTEFQRARLDCDDEGRLIASPVEQQGSGMLRGVAEADALIVLAEAQREFGAGELVEVLPLPGWP
ncbi:MAG TPA: gephyrin-like molybdotransferase Glp [Rudaea sp.]|nr:gephyrin-like molybdotransferase Glp [Rudaea sp.]